MIMLTDSRAACALAAWSLQWSGHKEKRPGLQPRPSLSPQKGGKEVNLIQHLLGCGFYLLGILYYASLIRRNRAQK